MEPTGKIQAMFQSLLDKKLPPGSKPPAEWEHYLLCASDELEPDGTIKGGLIPPIGLLPQSFQDFVGQVDMEMFDYVRRTIRVLRWRCGQCGPHDPILSAKPPEWSFDGVSWNIAPFSSSVHLMPLCVIRPSHEVKQQVLDYVRAGRSEPLGHELYHEAVQQAMTHPRSALAIGIAAAEVGIKQYISDVAPEARWLAENMPSPPLVKVLEEYLPTSPAKLSFQGKVLAPTAGMIKLFKKGVLLRNQLVHAGTPVITYDSLNEILDAVRDLLWLLDYYAGTAWALNYLSEPVKRELESKARP